MDYQVHLTQAPTRRVAWLPTIKHFSDLSRHCQMVNMSSMLKIPPGHRTLIFALYPEKYFFAFNYRGRGISRGDGYFPRISVNGWVIIKWNLGRGAFMEAILWSRVVLNFYQKIGKTIWICEFYNWQKNICRSNFIVNIPSSICNKSYFQVEITFVTFELFLIISLM